MKSTAKKSGLFYGLVAYVVLQFLWWEVLLARQTRQLAEEQKKISALHFTDRRALDENFQLIESKQNHQLWMHIGEGTVFLILLSIGVLKIESTRQKENELARRQNNFLLSVTHELKSPLASVKLQLQTIQKHSLDEGTKNRLIQKALSDNERLLRMIDNILLASRAENKNNILHLKRIELTQLLDKLIEQAFEESKGRIERCPSQNMYVEADEAFLSIIFSNLIENALKYTPVHSEIIIKLSQEKGLGQVAVCDEWPGISEEEKEKIFDKFYRIGNEETRSAKGTGLGLFIVKNLCDLQHIQIQIEDNAPKGSVFKLSFKTASA